MEFQLFPNYAYTCSHPSSNYCSNYPVKEMPVLTFQRALLSIHVIASHSPQLVLHVKSVMVEVGSND